MPEKFLRKYLPAGVLMAGGLLTLVYVFSRTAAPVKLSIPEIAISAGRYYVGPIFGKKDYRELANTSIRSLYMMQTEVTCELYARVRELSTASHGYQLAPLECDTHGQAQSALLPITGLSWWDACVFANALSAVSGREAVYRDSKGAVIKNAQQAQGDLIVERDVAADGYRLPTFEEWQIAARGGMAALDRGSYGLEFSGSDMPDDVAWISDAAEADLHAVGLK